MKQITIKDMVIIALLSALLFVLELALQVLPNIQLTVLLIVLFSKKLGLIRTSIIVLIHTLLDSFVNGFSIIYFPVMLIGWLIIPITLTTIFKKVEEPIYLALLGVLYSFLYSWIFAITSVIVANVNFFDYLLADILFELLLASSSFLSILWLYKPLSLFYDKVFNKEMSS